MRMRTCVAVLAAALCALTGAVGARADVTDADIQTAKDRLIAAQKDAGAAHERLRRADADAGAAKADLDRTEKEVEAIRSQLEALQSVIRSRAIEAYKNASNGSVSAFGLFVSDPDEGDSSRVARGQMYVRSVMSTDSESLVRMGALRDDLEAKRVEQAADSARLSKARNEAKAANDRLEASLKSAEAETAKLEQQKASEDAARAAAAASALAEATARGRAARGDGNGGPIPGGGGAMACPVQGPVSFVDSWGASRGGGRRSHKGVDMMAAEGTPAAAIVSGIISRTSDVERGLGGITIWLNGDNGVSYYYAHNQRNVVQPGERVAQGQVIGYVGRTGNARTTPAHVHFEVHPGGGGPVNPYPTAAAAC